LFCCWGCGCCWAVTIMVCFLDSGVRQKQKAYETAKVVYKTLK